MQILTHHCSLVDSITFGLDRPGAVTENYREASICSRPAHPPEYAIVGAVGATFYLEPISTLDVDVFRCSSAMHHELRLARDSQKQTRPAP
jgi:hypothetical protein